MSVVDLATRLTSDFNRFQELHKSSDSLLFVDGEVLLDSGGSSLELSVGPSFFHCREQKFSDTPDNGLIIEPGMAVVIETEQVIGVPTNMVGLVTGKGTYIWQGIFISSGKIDPNFRDRLRISLFNGGDRHLTLKRREPFCSLCFFQSESQSSVLAIRLPLNPPTEDLQRLPIKKRIARVWQKDWGWILSILLATIGILIAIFKK